MRVFTSVEWLVVESDSQDGTLDQLTEIARRIPHFRYLSLGALQPKLPLRTERLAYCRNAYLDEFRSNSNYSAIDYLVVADLDGANELLTAAAVSSCWSRSDWEGCTANQRGRYYDIWALRHPTWCPTDCWQDHRALVARGMDHERARERVIYSRMRAISEQSPWVAVESAFGGLGIYRRSAIGAAQYIGLGPEGEEVCEHVAFHRTIRSNGARLYINPALINSGYNEHTWATRLVPTLRRKWRIARRTFLRDFHS